jgi:hypothetical protein
MTIKDDNTLDDAPPETVALWVDAVRTMDRDVLESVIVRLGRTWSRESLKPLETAVRARRAEFETR